jgi:hypothetical protein
MWNPIAFAIYFEKLSIAKMLLEDYTHNVILA